MSGRSTGVGRAVVVGIGSLMVVAGLTGCSAIQGLMGGTATRDDETQEVTEAGTEGVFTVRVGDCFDDTTSGQVSEVPVVPCAEPHDNEVFAAFDMPAGEWPGESAIRAFADENCTPAFADFVGMPYEDSELYWFPFTPTQGSWENAADHEVLCVIYEDAVRVEGTLEGAAR